MKWWTFLKAFEEDLDRDLGAKTASMGFAGRQRSVFPEFVAAVASPAEAEVLTGLLAAVDPAAHVAKEPFELVGSCGLHQGNIPQISQIERAVTVARDGKQFWIECREIALGIDAEDRKRPVELVLRHALFALNQTNHLIKFPENHRVAVLFAQSPESAEEIGVLRLHFGTLH